MNFKVFRKINIIFNDNNYKIMNYIKICIYIYIYIYIYILYYNFVSNKLRIINRFLSKDDGFSTTDLIHVYTTSTC